MRFFILLTLLLASAGTGCKESLSSNSDRKPSSTPLDPFEQNRKLGRGINLGNALEAPSEGEWGIVIEKNWLKLIHDAGFTHVRLPIRWSPHAETTAPYTIDPVFLNRVTQIVDWSLEQNLMIMINFHHYEELYENPAKEAARFKELWKQVAHHFKDHPDEVLFEVLNEPHGNLTPTLWNMMIPDLLPIIRAENPGRTLVFGLADYGGLGGLDALTLPDDENIIVTPHYYNPFEFTHQGAEWVQGANAWSGRTWTGTTSEKLAVDRDFDRLKEWAASKNVPLHIGEFGAYSKAPAASRVTWTAYVAKAAIDRNMSFAYWEWASGFGIYNKETNQLNTGLWKALMGRE